MAHLLRIIGVLLGLVLAVCHDLPAQVRYDSLMVVKGTVQFSDSAVQPYTISIKAVGNNSLISFTRFTKSSFALPMPVVPADTVRILVQSPGYIIIDTLLPRTFLAAGEIQVMLEKIPTTLENVDVLPKRYWRRGDTTFYDVASFENGTEERLGDLVGKLPGLQRDTDGTLKFNGKPVEKILLEDQELFADNIQLLLNNLPVKVIKRIEVRENQVESELERGLVPGQKVFMNIKLKDGVRWKPVFGDATAGVAHTSRYLLHPTLFSLAGKSKVGLIANVNSIGDIPDFLTMSENSTLEYRRAIAFNQHDDNINSIPLDHTVQYLQNRQVHVQFQMNTPISKTVGSMLRLGYLQDERSQMVLSEGQYLSGAETVFRVDSQQLQYAPRLGYLHYQLSHKPGTNKESVLAIHGQVDMSKSISASRGLQDNTVFDLTTALQQRYWSLGLVHQLGIRKSNTRLHRWEQRLFLHQLPQNSNGTSNNWANMLPGLTPDINIITQQRANRTLQYEGNWTNTRKRERQAQSTGVYMNIQMADLGIDAAGDSVPGSSAPPTFAIAPIAQRMFLVRSGFTFSPEALMIKGVTIRPTLKLGAGLFQFREAGDQETQASPEYEASLWVTPTNRKRRNFSLTLSDKYMYDYFYRMGRVIVPTGMLSYRRQANNLVPLHVSSLGFNGAAALGKKAMLTYSLSGGMQWNASAALNTFNGGITTSVDSLINRSSMYVSMSSTLKKDLNGASLFNSFIDISLQSVLNRNWTLGTEQALALWTQNNSLTLKLVSNHLTFLALEASNTFSADVFFPAQVKPFQDVLIFSNNSYIQVTGKPADRWSIFTKAAVNALDIGGDHANALAVVQMGGRYLFKQIPISLTLRVDNALNQRSYRQFFNNGYAQSRFFTDIPLLPRQVLLLLNYTLK